jgi:3',5'-cyclic AMP phosphodiesterase CpdA
MTEHNHEEDNKTDRIATDQSDGIDRRGFLKCMAWAGTGLLCTVNGGILKSALLGSAEAATNAHGGELHFVQISDSHIGFGMAANKDVIGTLKKTIDKINALPEPPAFLLHTGDLTHLAQADEFDTVAQLLKSARTTSGQVFYVPGEHDMLGDNGKKYLAQFGHAGSAQGWYSFDHNGIHFVGLNNVQDHGDGGLGRLGDAQIAWLKDDLAPLKSSTPLVIFAHVPLWSVYPEWGWGTQDSAQALALTKRFGSVTVLNGHIHQALQKVEGNVRFHTAMSTAFPQPKPGAAPKPGPMAVPADVLPHVLGITQVEMVPRHHHLAIIDSTLA